MQIVNASSTNGLLRALEGATRGGRGPTTLYDGVDVRTWIEGNRTIDVLILDDQITAFPNETIENTLWELIYLARQRPSPARVVLLLHDDMLPLTIRDALTTLVQEHGGSVYLIPRRGGQYDAAASAWVVQQLPATAARAQHWIMPLSAAGGVGKSSQLTNIALGLSRAGHRVLVMDADIANGSLCGTFKVDPSTVESFLTLRHEFPKPTGMYPLDAVQRRILPHRSGVDLLLSGRGLGEVDDLGLHAMRALLASVRQLPYDVVAFDAGPDIKARPYALDVLREGGFAVVIAQPGRKERRGAENVLELLSQLTAPGKNTSLLSQAGLLMIDPEEGSVASTAQVQQDLLRQFAGVANLGTIPRDARLLSAIAERLEWTSAWDVDAKSLYCRAVAAATLKLSTLLNLAPPGQEADPPSSTPKRRGGLGSFFGRSLTHAGDAR